MIATARHPSLLYVLALAVLVLLMLAAIVGLANAPLADPPWGTWNGETADGAVVTMTLTEDGGFRLDGATSEPVVGMWTWNASSAEAGTLGCEPTDWRTDPPRVYNVKWLAPGRIELSNETFKVTLNRII